MSATISKMYKLSGGCKREYTCSQCRYYAKSEAHPKEHICKKHGEDGTNWKNWMACKFFHNPIKARKKKEQKPKYGEETTGQLKLIF